MTVCPLKHSGICIFRDRVISFNEGKWIFNKMRGCKLTVKFSYIDVLGNLDKIIFKRVSKKTTILSKVAETQEDKYHIFSSICIIP